MNRCTAFGIALIFAVLASGCTPQDPKSKMRRATAEYTEATNLIATIKDRASFEAAKPKLKRHCAWVREQNRENQAKKNSNSTNAQDANFAMKEFEKLANEPEFKQLMDAA